MSITWKDPDDVDKCWSRRVEPRFGCLSVILEESGFFPGFGMRVDVSKTASFKNQL